LGGFDDGVGGDAEDFHDLRTWGAETEAIDADDLAVEADIFPPEGGDAGFDGDAGAAGGWENGVAVVEGLGIEAMEAGDADDADTITEGLGGDDGVLDFGTCGEEDGFEWARFFDEDVAAMEDALASGFWGGLIEHGDGLATEGEESGAVGAEESGGESAGGFFGIGGADDIEIGDDAEATDGFDGLMSGAVFADADGVVGEDINDGEVGESGDANGAAAVVGEDEESGAAGAEESIIGEAVEDAAHAVFADAEADIATVAIGGIEVFGGGDVIEGGAIEIGAAADEIGDGVGDGLEDIASGFAGGDFGIGGKLWDEGEEIGGDVLGEGGGELGIEVWVGDLPSGESGFPSGVFGEERRAVFGEISAGFWADEEVFGFWEAEGLAGGGDEFGATFAVRFGGSCDFGDAFADEGFSDNDLGFIGSGLGFLESVEKGHHVLAVDGLDTPFDGAEAFGGIFALGFGCHGVEGDIIGIVNEDEVIELVVASEGDGFHGDAFLHATVAGEDDDMVIENGEVWGVEFGGGHFLGDGVSDGVGDALAEGTGGGFDAGGFVEFGVTWGPGAEGAEFLNLVVVDGGIAGEVEPGVEEHGAVTGAEDEAIAVEPMGIGGVVGEGLAEENGTDFCATEGETEVTGVAGMNGVHGEATGFVSGTGESGNIHRMEGEIFGRAEVRCWT